MITQSDGMSGQRVQVMYPGRHLYYRKFFVRGESGESLFLKWPLWSPKFCYSLLTFVGEVDFQLAMSKKDNENIDRPRKVNAEQFSRWKLKIRKGTRYGKVLRRLSSSVGRHFSKLSGTWQAESIASHRYEICLDKIWDHGHGWAVGKIKKNL